MSLLVDHQIRSLCFMPSPGSQLDGTDGLNAKECSMIYPFSEGVDSDGVISYGLTSAGYDLRLGNHVMIFKNTRNEIISPKRMKSDPAYLARIFDILTDLKQGEAIVLPPAPSYILAVAYEHLRLPSYLKGRCVGKSSNARCGLIVNTTPVEPGWAGYLTIEISNSCPCPVEIYVGEGIAQMEFEELVGTPEVDYAKKKGKYQDQKAEPIPAKVKV